MPRSIKVVLIRFHCLPALLPFDVLNEFPKASFHFCFCLCCLIDLPNSLSYIPVARLMDICINASSHACRIPEILAKRLGGEQCTSCTQEQWYGVRINLLALRRLDVIR